MADEVGYHDDIEILVKWVNTLYSWLNFRVRGQFEIKILLVRLRHTTYFLRIKKIGLEPAVNWKLVTCQRITSKSTRPRWVDTRARDTVRWHWSADTLFWQVSIDHNMDVQYQVAPGLPNYYLQLENVRLNIGFPAVRTDGRSAVGVLSRDYQIF